MPRPSISAVINFCHIDDPDQLRRCLESVADFAQEIVIINMDKPEKIEFAREFNAKIYPHKYTRIVEPVRNFGLSKATGKWITLLDPDEIITKALKRELLKVTSRPDVDFVKIPRKNIVFGRWLRHTGMWPDYLIRFFRKGAVTWQSAIHSQPITTGNGMTLMDSDQLAIKHYNYPSIGRYLEHAIRYSKRQADELLRQQYKVRTGDFLLKPIQEFNSRFFAAEGFKDGLHGLVFSLLQGMATLLIYVRLWEKQGFEEKNLSKESFVSAASESVYEFDHWFTKYYSHEYSANLLLISIIKFRHFIYRLTRNT